MGHTDIDAMKKSNRPHKTVVSDIIKRIEDNEDAALKQKMANMSLMKPFAAQRLELYTEAREKGIHSKALKALIKARDQLRKLVVAAEKLDDDTADEYSHMRDQMDLFGIVPMSEGAKKASAKKDEEIKTLNAEIADLKVVIDSLENGVDTAEPDPVAEKPRLKTVK